MYREVPPHPALAAHVDRLWASASVAEDAPGERRILPDGCVDVIVELADPTRIEIVGTMTRAVVVPPVAPPHVTRTVAVRFRPGGAPPFLRTAAGELTDLAVAAGDLALTWLSPDAFAGCASLDDGLGRLERALLARVTAIDAPHPMIAHAVGRLFAAAPPSIAELGTELGWTRQHLARMFGVHIGVSPKQLARVARLQRAVIAVQTGAELAAAAVDAGYFDQAHMALDFRDLADVTPLEAGSRPGSIVPIRSLFAPP